MSLVRASNEHRRHETTVILGTVLAVLLVLMAPRLASLWRFDSPIRLIEEVALTGTAQRALRELPGAFQAGSLVVVPADTDPFVAWGEGVSSYRVDGEVVDLGVRGLAPYGDLPAARSRPEWLETVSIGDGVFSDLGNLWFACIRPPSSSECDGTLLAAHSGRRYIFRSDLGSPTAPQPMMRVSGFGSGGELDVWLGWVPEGAATVWATVVGQQSVRELPAQTAEPGTVAGSTLWWVRTSDPVSAVAFRDARGRVVERHPVGAAPSDELVPGGD